MYTLQEREIEYACMYTLHTNARGAPETPHLQTHKYTQKYTNAGGAPGMPLSLTHTHTNTHTCTPMPEEPQRRGVTHASHEPEELGPVLIQLDNGLSPLSKV